MTRIRTVQSGPGACGRRSGCPQNGVDLGTPMTRSHRQIRRQVFARGAERRGRNLSADAPHPGWFPRVPLSTRDEPESSCWPMILWVCRFSTMRSKHSSDHSSSGSAA